VKKIIYGVTGSGKSTFAAKLCTEQGHTLFGGKGIHMEELRSGDDARAFFLTGKPGDIASLQANSAEAAQERFKELVGNDSIDLSGIEFVAVPAWSRTGLAA
jgi:nucleoside-triphosphatase THEP1